MEYKIRRIAAIWALLVCSCQTQPTLTSTKVGESNTGNYDTSELSGPVYYLPVSYLEIEGKVCPAAERPAGNRDGGGDANAAKGDDVNITVSPTTTINVSGGEASPPKSSSKASSTKAACPAGKFQITVKETTLADPQEAYVSRMDLARFSTDKPNLKINSSGLLSSVSAVSKDETRETLVSFAEAVGLAFGFAVDRPKGVEMFGLQMKSEREGDRPPPEFRPFKVLCKISEQHIGDTVSGCISLDGGSVEGLSLKIYDLPKKELDGELAEQNGKPKPVYSQCNPNAGLCFRSRRDALLHVTYEENNRVQDCQPQQLASVTALLKVNIVDPMNSFTVSAYRRAFVQTTTNMTFENGVLVGFDGEYPSTGGAIVTLPADFIGGIFTGIGNALDFQAENTNSEAELIKAQTALIEAQAALETARKEAADTDADADDDGGE